MLQQIHKNDNGFINKAYGITYEDFKIWLQKEFSVDNGDIEDGMVPQSSYWMYDGDTPVGYGRIRHYLNDYLEKIGGHIGYAIASNKRGKGYGTEILSLLNQKCVDLGLKEIQIGANVDNKFSNNVFLHKWYVLMHGYIT